MTKLVPPDIEIACPVCRHRAVIRGHSVGRVNTFVVYCTRLECRAERQGRLKTRQAALSKTKAQEVRPCLLCDNPTSRRGLCDKHYRQRLREEAKTPSLKPPRAFREDEDDDRTLGPKDWGD